MTGGVFTISGGLTEPVFDEIVVVLAVALGGAATVDLNYFNFYLNSLKKLDEKKNVPISMSTATIMLLMCSICFCARKSYVTISTISINLLWLILFWL